MWIEEGGELIDLDNVLSIDSKAIIHGFLFGYPGKDDYYTSSETYYLLFGMRSGEEIWVSMDTEDDRDKAYEKYKKMLI